MVIIIVYVLIMLLIMFIVYLIAENNLLITSKYKCCFKDLPESFEGFKILQISDLHTKTYGHNWQRLIIRIYNMHPDIIVITGDLVSRNAENYKNTEILLRRITQICPVFYSLGNHELDMNKEKRKDLFKKAEDLGVIILDNERREMIKNTDKINIIGYSLKSDAYKNSSGGYKNLNRITSDDIERAAGGKSEFTVLLAHNPFFFDEYIKWGADLTLSGHVHGGIIRLPFLGGILSPERRFFPKYSKGMFKKDKKAMVVSAGIGKLRMFNPPELVMIVLSKEN